MSYSDDVMQSLKYQIRDLNNNLVAINDLKEELKLFNRLKMIELQLQVGSITPQDGKVLLEELKPKETHNQKNKKFF